MAQLHCLKRAHTQSLQESRVHSEPKLTKLCEFDGVVFGVRCFGCGICMQVFEVLYLLNPSGLCLQGFTSSRSSRCTAVTIATGLGIGQNPVPSDEHQHAHVCFTDAQMA